MSNTIPSKTAVSVQTFFTKLCDEHGFKITSSRYLPEVFGNIQIVASSDLFNVDYRLDRGDESLYLVVRGREYLIADIHQLLFRRQFSQVSIESEQTFISAHIDALRSLFSENQISQSIQALESMRVDRLHRMFPGSVSQS